MPTRCSKWLFMVREVVTRGELHSVLCLCVNTCFANRLYGFLEASTSHPHVNISLQKHEHQTNKSLFTFSVYPSVQGCCMCWLHFLPRRFVCIWDLHCFLSVFYFALRPSSSSPLDFIGATLFFILIPPVDQQNSMKPSTGMCITSPVWWCTGFHNLGQNTGTRLTTTSPAYHGKSSTTPQSSFNLSLKKTAAHL